MTDEQNDLTERLEKLFMMTGEVAYHDAQREIERLRAELADEYMHGYKVGIDDDLTWRHTPAKQQHQN